MYLMTRPTLLGQSQSLEAEARRGAVLLGLPKRYRRIQVGLDLGPGLQIVENEVLCYLRHDIDYKIAPSNHTMTHFNTFSSDFRPARPRKNPSQPAFCNKPPASPEFPKRQTLTGALDSGGSGGGMARQKSASPQLPLRSSSSV